MNNPEVVRWAAAMARSINAPDTATAVRGVYRRALGREPLAGELADGGTFITAQAASYAGEDARQLALADFCQAIFGLNEFVYLQ
jgi:hypothetical protein